MASPRTPFSSADETKIIASLSRHSARNRALFVMGLHCGFRASELGRLSISHVWCNGEVRTSVALERRHLKGGRGAFRRSVKARTLPLSPFLRQILFEYLQDRFDGCPVDLRAPLFPGEGGQGLSRWQFNRIVKQVVADAGCFDGRYGTHSLRKTFADRVYRASGHDINLTRAALGHQSITTTIRYLSLDSESVDAAILAAAAIGPVERSTPEVVQPFTERIPQFAA